MLSVVHNFIFLLLRNADEVTVNCIIYLLVICYFSVRNGSKMKLEFAIYFILYILIAIVFLSVHVIFINLLSIFDELVWQEMGDLDRMRMT